MAAQKDKSATDTASAAQNRFVVSLPKEVGTSIDKLAVNMCEAMRKQYGIGVELTRAQVVTSLVQSALDAFESGETEQEGGEQS